MDANSYNGLVQAFSFHASDRVITRVNQTTGAFDRSRKTINFVEHRSVIFEENHWFHCQNM